VAECSATFNSSCRAPLVTSTRTPVPDRLSRAVPDFPSERQDFYSSLASCPVEIIEHETNLGARRTCDRQSRSSNAVGPCRHDDLCPAVQSTGSGTATLKHTPPCLSALRLAFGMQTRPHEGQSADPLLALCIGSAECGFVALERVNK